MSSIIVLDSSDEETDNPNKKQRTRNTVPQVQSMARVNPVKAPNASVTAKKLPMQHPNDNFKIHLPSKRSTANEQSFNDAVPPEKRIRRVKPTTVVRSNDEEWVNRQQSGSVISRNGINSPVTPMLSKNLVNSVKNPIRVVKSPITVGSPTRSVPNPARIVAHPTSSKASSSYVRVAWNAKDGKPTSPPVINKSITTTVKEQPKGIVTPPVINKNITATVKDTTKVVSLSPPIFNKNSVTIRRVLVNDERPNAAPGAKNAIIVDPPKAATIGPNSSTSIRRVPMATDPLKITPPTPPASKTVNNNSGVRIAPVNATSGTSIRRVIGQSDTSATQSLSILKRNTTTVATAPIVQYANPATIKRIVTVDLPKTPASPPVISKNYGPTPKKLMTEQPKSSMSMSVITKNHVAKASDKKMSPPVLPKPQPNMINRPSGLTVTPITCTALTQPVSVPPTPHLTPVAVGRASLPNPSRAAAKPSRTANSRARVGSAASAEQSLAAMASFNTFPPGYIGGPGGMYDMNTSGGPFINPAYIPNRPMRSLEGPNYPTMSAPVFNVNYHSFSGGSITPVASPGAAASPTYNRSTKSPITSTVTRYSNAIRSPAGFMGMPIDVDQPIPPMSPPVYNMNHPAYNGDPFNFMRGAPSQTIPSPAYSPVRCTQSPAPNRAPNENLTTVTSPSSPVFHIDLDNFVRNPLSYPRTNCNTATSSTTNGPIFSVDSPARNYFKSPSSTITSPAQSILSEGSSISEEKNRSKKPTNNEDDGNGKGDEKDLDEEDDDEEEVEKEPLNPEFETLLQSCRDADSSEDMNRLIKSKLVRYYYSVHPDFVKSRGFRKAVVAATDSIKKKPELVYYHLRPVVEEMKARKKSKAIVMTNDETSAAASAADEGIEEKVRQRQIRRLNKGLYILTRKIHKLENEDVDLDDENSTYLIVERYKKRACEIYDKICDLTGESKHALRQVKKPINFKATAYPKFNKVVETFVNRTKEFPDFFDVLRMLEFCNERYNFNLLKEEMTMIAQDAFIKIGKVLQSRRKADLYETVSHFTSDFEDPAANDPTLLAKLADNEKTQTSIGSIINKYAREQVRRKAESANASGEELNNSSDSCETDAESHDDDQSSNNNNTEKKKDMESKELAKVTTNGTHTPPSPAPHIATSTTLPPPPPPPSSSSPASASTSAAFRTSPPHAFASPQASPRPRSLSPLPPPPTPEPASTMTVNPCTTSSLKILSVTSLNDAVCGKKPILIDKPAVVTAAAVSVDEIVISDEDL